MDSILTIERYLANVKNRNPDSSLDKQIRESLQSLKKKAVAEGNEEEAKNFWCYETIRSIQNQYISAFQMMKTQYFYPAWCLLERVEIDLGFLERHFNLNNNGSDIFLLSFIKKHTGQFQSLFPYRAFFSPGFVALEKKCSICGEPISIHQPCGHIAGEIYRGEMCEREITNVELIEISIVNNPVQKYSVAFMFGENAEDNTEDPYNYCHVDYVVRGLAHPFTSWDIYWTTKKRSISEFRNIGRNDKCPCGSGKKFKVCCNKKGVIEGRHLSVRFAEAPPPNLPIYEDNVFVRGKGSPIKPPKAENLIDHLDTLEATENE
jgi:hypothetical protein